MKRCSADIQLINSQKKMKRLQKEEFKKKTYLEDSNNVIKFHIVDKYNDTITEAPGVSLKKNNACLVPFRPLFTHQVFSSAEKIHGYTGLKIDIYLTWATLKWYLRVRYNKCAEKRDNIEKLLSKHFGGNFTLDPNKFKEWLKEDLEEFRPVGKKVYEFDRICDKHRHYEVYKVRLNDKKFPTHMNRCLQAMLYFYIESASFIEKDSSWNYFVLYEVVKKFKNNPTSYRLIGYTTTYENTEAKNSTNRISQFLILPPYQKLGFGKALVEGIYKHYIKSKNCSDISVEKPTKAFHMLWESVKANLLGTESKINSVNISTEDKDSKG